MVAAAYGQRPLLPNSLRPDGDDASMVVEVTSSVGDEDVTANESPIPTPTATPSQSEAPPLRVMHRSFIGDDVSIIDNRKGKLGDK